MASYSVYDIGKIRNPELRAILENIMDVTAGHDHDGTNTKAVSVSAIADDAITTGKILDANVTLAKLSAGVQASLALADSAIQADDVRLAPGTPTNAKAASGTLTILGVVKDGETVQIGDDVYEFCSDAAQSLTAGSTIAVNIEAHTTKGAINLTVDTIPALGDTFTVGTKTYYIVPAASTLGEGDVALGDLATSQANIVAAINGTDGHNTANTKASAGEFNANVSAITALAGGTHSVPTTETFATGSNQFSGAALAGGADCSAANAVTALVAEITASDTQGVGAADGANDTVVCTADALGVAGNSIDTVAVMANGSFGAAHLAGGQAGTVGDQWQTYADSSYLYVAVAANTATGANWRRIGLGTAY
jgi:hypothetical protein